MKYKPVKMIATLGVLLGLIIITGTMFLILSPQFGKSATKSQKAEYSSQWNHNNGKFINHSDSPMDLDYWSLLKEMFKDAPNRNPVKNIEVEKIDSATIVNHSADITQLTWFGHSAFLLEIDGKKILIDPMFGQVPAPHPLLGPKRYSKELPIAIEKLPFIDAVVLSHDHYDHLDYGSILKLKGKVGHYFTPLGVGNHLEDWGISPEIIHTLNWWEAVDFAGLNFTCAPARHFSGRGLFDRAETLWSSWIVTGKNHKIFFSGDSGYDTHFKEIGEKYGPFDISLMECGQYNEDWKFLHMMPEETIRASIDLKSKLVMPIHWGGFTLALHDWMEPVERALDEAKKLNVLITTPKIGEPVILGKDTYPTGKWWKDYIKKK